MLAVAGTAPEIIRRLNAEISAAMPQPDVRERLLAQCAEPLCGPPD